MEGKKERKYIHRCPLCDRFRKVVKANLESVWEEFRLLVANEHRGLFVRREDVWRMRKALIDPFSRIHRAFSVFETKGIEGMTEEEFKAYLATEMADSEIPPIIPTIAIPAEGFEARASTLTPLHSGKGLSSEGKAKELNSEKETAGSGQTTANELKEWVNTLASLHSALDEIMMTPGWDLNKGAVRSNILAHLKIIKDDLRSKLDCMENEVRALGEEVAKQTRAGMISKPKPSYERMDNVMQANFQDEGRAAYFNFKKMGDGSNSKEPRD